MRTTLTLDDDVTKLLEAAQKKRDGSFKSIVNQALRLGLLQLDEPARQERRSYTLAVSLGECRLPNVDDLSTVLAVAEGESFR